MPRITDHETRKKDILLSAIEVYLNVAVPGSSDILRKSKKMNISSATVRNVFSELEEAGLLSHPHTSAGRVPTDKGYRYYLNVLMKKKRLKEDEANYIDKIYDLKVLELDDLLSETSRIMSDFTHYTSLVYMHEDSDDKVVFQGVRYILEHPEFHDIKKARMILEALEKKEELLDLIMKNFSGATRVYVGKECDSPGMENCAVIVSQYAGKNKRSGRLALIGPKRRAYDQVIPLMDYISEVFAKNIERF
jgi:transcriptional regulator of heat shock response